MRVCAIVEKNADVKCVFSLSFMVCPLSKILPFLLPGFDFAY